MRIVTTCLWFCCCWNYWIRSLMNTSKYVSVIRWWCVHVIQYCSVRHRNCHYRLELRHEQTYGKKRTKKRENWSESYSENWHTLTCQRIYLYIFVSIIRSTCSEFGVCANVNKTFLRLNWWCCKAIEHNTQSIRTPNGNPYTNVYFCCSVNSYR